MVPRSILSARSFSFISIWMWFSAYGFAQTKLPQPLSSPINGLQVHQPDSGKHFRFLVGGHFYGSHDNRLSIHPASSLLANIPRINQSGASILFSCGDLMRDGSDPIHQKALLRSIQALSMPIWNAPGNHDLPDRKSYMQQFGPTQAAFILNRNLFWLLDTEYWVEGKGDEVLKYLREQRKTMEMELPFIQNVFVFSHRLVWATLGAPFAEADEVCNQPILRQADVEAGKKIVEEIIGFAPNKPLYWFSGDVGTKCSVPLLAMENPAHGQYFFAAGLGDTPEDALLMVEVDQEGKTTVSPYSLTGMRLEPIQSYGLAWAKDHIRLEAEAVPTDRWWTRKVLWGGMALGLLIGTMVGFMFGRRRKKG